MLDRLRSFLRRRYAPLIAWFAVVTLAMAWPVVFPYVPPQGVTVREDTTNFAMFEMSGDNYAAILGAVQTGRLTVSDMQFGFKLFTRGSLSKQQLSRRVITGSKVISQYIAERQAVARPPLVAIWAALALGLPGLWLASRVLLERRTQPLTAPPVRPEMM
jgi:hypothetical protein